MLSWVTRPTHLGPGFLLVLHVKKLSAPVSLSICFSVAIFNFLLSAKLPLSEEYLWDLKSFLNHLALAVSLLSLV